mmetsp:Transcript_3161/g.5878  ORF Transcript_3161/g.5878 Transcript_3161/m.5878 type:complete len:392 (+) Transcript_3161:68-1243(+)
MMMGSSKHGTCITLLVPFLFHKEFINASSSSSPAVSHHGTIFQTAQAVSFPNRCLRSSVLTISSSCSPLCSLNDKIFNMRGGAYSPTTDPTRTLWASPSSTQQHPQTRTTTSTQSSSASSYYRTGGEAGIATVTDVTDEIKDQQREKTKDAINAFLTRESRNSFIVKVYAILTGQLVLVALSALLFGRYPALGRWMMTSSAGRVVPWASIFISTMTVMFMTVSERARQVAPLKWQLLGLFSISEAIVVGLISSFYKSKTVMSAVLSTAVATMSVTMYTLLNKNSKRDLSQWGASLSSMGMIFVCYGILHLLSISGILPPEFLPYNETVYCFLGTSLFTLYLAYHTRLVVSGKHSKYQLNEKDYVFGAVLLYNDIINIFLYMLRLLADDREQ